MPPTAAGYTTLPLTADILARADETLPMPQNTLSEAFLWLSHAGRCLGDQHSSASAFNDPGIVKLCDSAGRAGDYLFSYRPNLPSKPKSQPAFPRILVSTVYSGIFIQVAGHKSQISGINLGSIWDIRLMPCCLDLTLSVPVFNVSQRRSVGD